MQGDIYTPLLQAVTSLMDKPWESRKREFVAESEKQHLIPDDTESKQASG